MSNIDNKKDIRYQVFVTSTMDDKVTQIAQVMGLSKMELIRYFIAQGCLAYESGMKMIQDNADKIIDIASDKSRRK